eukprot:TRINITY_DN2461_c0_g1_i1.p1 TRINITY_DN2461_c0_g1~~TRINITY_DN2461_c0_g1_i1.p1  ORF type:complete len:193 (+),score=-14.23 TRINITY_DN2461_c0_g1_i1:354-932(+)
MSVQSSPGQNFWLFVKCVRKQRVFVIFYTNLILRFILCDQLFSSLKYLEKRLLCQPEKIAKQQNLDVAKPLCATVYNQTKYLNKKYERSQFIMGNINIHSADQLYRNTTIIFRSYYILIAVPSKITQTQQASLFTINLVQKIYFFYNHQDSSTKLYCSCKKVQLKPRKFYLYNQFRSYKKYIAQQNQQKLLT